MRLLNSATLQLEDFAYDEIPPYAILSHTWGREEVLFADFGTVEAQSKSGHSKIKGACRQTLKDGLQYIWIDTCCIDKGSSAELSEAINSMYTWYVKAEVCYAYLSDVSEPSAIDDSGVELPQSRWFTRGWTLQELLAPETVIFFCRGWIKIGEKSAGMAVLLSSITGIDEEFLIGAQPVQVASVAKRMSWAARRITSRPEDLAYCLMGIFSVNMPMLYGEGHRAFIRLQEEIMKVSDDETLFAWTNPDALPDTEYGLLATSPKFFADSSSFVPHFAPRGSVPYSMTNQGLRIILGISHIGSSKNKSLDISENTYIAALNCPGSGESFDSLALYLRKASAGEHYARIRCAQLVFFHADYATDEEIRIRQTPSAIMSQDPYDIFLLLIKDFPPIEHGYNLVSILGTEGDLIMSQADGINIMLRKTPGNLAVAILFDSREPERILVSLGTRKRTQIGFSAINVPMPISTAEEALTGRDISFHPPGTWVELVYHRVCVEVVKSRSVNTQKEFYVKIAIEAVQSKRPYVQKGNTRTVPPAEEYSSAVYENAKLPKMYGRQALHSPSQ